MADRNTRTTPASLSDLPILPTGSGVADLEVAYEQMKLADDAQVATDVRSADEPETYDPAVTPTQGGHDAAESAAHPS